MNSRIAPTLCSVFGAAIVTIAMLASVNGLATGQSTAAQLMRAASSTASV